MKMCTGCKLEKSTSEFHKKSNSRDGLQNRCKTCAIEDRIRRYWANHEDERRVRRVWSNANHRRNRDRLDGYLKEHPCIDCGEADILVLEFDHVRGEKHRTISEMLSSCSWETLLKEIAKCEVRCANDHRRRHNGNRPV